MIGLENLINSGREILIDTCLISRGSLDKVFYRDHRKNILSEIDIESLRKEDEGLAHGMNLLSCRNVFVIKEIENEIFAYKTFTLDRIERMEKKVRDCDKKKDNIKIRYLAKMKEKLNKLPFLLEKSRISYTNPIFDSLNYIFQTIENSLDPNRDPLNASGTMIKYDHASYTDIRLVSAFYLRKILGNPTVIFTADRDIKKLIGVSAGIFLEKYFDGIDIFRRRIKKEEPVLYKPNNENRYSLYEERWINLMNLHRRNTIPEEKREMVYRKLKKEMRKIEDSMCNQTI